MTLTKPGDLLGKLSEKWRKLGVYYEQEETLGGTIPTSGSAKIMCADDLDAALAKFRPVMEKLVEAGEAMAKHHLATAEFSGLAFKEQTNWDAALAEYRKVLHE